MFVKNLSNEELQFKKNGAVLKLKPGVNCVDILKWDIEDLRKTYNPSILVFIGEEPQAEEKAEKVEAPEEQVEAPKAPEAKEENGEAGEADQADKDLAEDKAEADKKDEGEAVKTETEDKAPAKATAKVKAPKATGKKK